MVEIVLVQPEIPQNTGNVGRTCVSIGCRLHLVGPLGFSLSDSHLKRAGLDYWSKLDVHVYEGWSEFYARHQDRTLFCFSTKGSRLHSQVQYPRDALLVFGQETAGLSAEILALGTKIRLPMRPGNRSLNLSNTVAVAAYEWLRQWQYPGLE